MSMRFSELYCAIMRENGLGAYCEEPYVGLFERFLQIFMEENRKTNLSAIRNETDAIAKHLADCLLAADWFPNGATVLDVGCGGGFPTFPLAIARPDLRITAVDSTRKKVDFVAYAAKELALHNIFPICTRAEDLAHGNLREAFDVVTGRAVANLRVLAELTLPAVRVGGALIAFKGAQGSDEAADASSAIRTLGGALEQDCFVELACPISDDAALDDFAALDNLAASGDFAAFGAAFRRESRHILLIRKQKPTPADYPRPYATILKRPL